VTRLAFREHCGEAFDFDLFWTAATTRFHAAIKSQLCLKPGVIELLDILDRAELPRAIATSSRHEDVQRNLAIHGLLDRFPTVIARGDYLRGKPGPDPFFASGRTAGARTSIMRRAGRFPSRRPIRIERRNDDHHGAGPVAADRRNARALRGHRPGPPRGLQLDEIAANSLARIW
jgi:Haloacid dehalogenase-like hydrolase